MGSAPLCSKKPDGSLLWKYKSNGGIISSPAIAGRRHRLYRLLGQAASLRIVRWRPKMDAKTADHIVSSPAITPDGAIFFGSGDYYLFSMTPAGKATWSFGTGTSSTPHRSSRPTATFTSAPKTRNSTSLNRTERYSGLTTPSTTLILPPLWTLMARILLARAIIAFTPLLRM